MLGPSDEDIRLFGRVLLVLLTLSLAGAFFLGAWLL
jgi:hypothetical protein